MSPIIIILAIIGGIVIFISPFMGLLATVALIPKSLLPAVGNMLFGVSLGRQLITLICMWIRNGYMA